MKKTNIIHHKKYLMINTGQILMD